MVVLDQQTIVEPDTMIFSATTADGIFFQQAEAGGGLAGVVDVGAGPGDGTHITMSLRGDTGKTLDEIQQNSFGREKAAQGTGYLDQGKGYGGIGEKAFEGFQGGAITGGDLKVGVVDAADHGDDGESADDSGLFLDDNRLAGGSGRDKQPAGDIVPAQILAFGELDQGGNLFVKWKAMGHID